MAAKAERKSRDNAAAWTRARAALDRLPEGGEPIKIGHHSEGRHRNAIAKADNTMRKSVEASADATHAQARADAATHPTDARYRPVTVANRIDTLGGRASKAGTAHHRTVLRRRTRLRRRNRNAAAGTRGVPGPAHRRAARPDRLLGGRARRPDRERHGHRLRPYQRQEG
ncbi:DUF3560 domain-containing protein [Cryobacterium fucosi]|uniref:DUF3560 domain-containing protein n=1 Tax=Cryobacterium fucosi TaxID=1259157 RepID=A0A4V3IV14_9MICO|nr:DUF3560 domain-containing protein [Cryobacterium fucosi]